MSEKGLGRFFKAADIENLPEGDPKRDAAYQEMIASLNARIAELEGAVGRPTFIDMDDDALTQIAAEDAAVIIRAARTRATKLVEQASETLQKAESDREQIRASASPLHPQ